MKVRRETASLEVAAADSMRFDMSVSGNGIMPALRPVLGRKQARCGKRGFHQERHLPDFVPLVFWSLASPRRLDARRLDESRRPFERDRPPRRGASPVDPNTCSTSPTTRE
jgi:hypothetical protein